MSLPSSNTSSNFFDEALSSDLLAYERDILREQACDSMASELSSFGWCELECSPDLYDFSHVVDVLNGYAEASLLDTPSVVQFYHDLYGFGDYESSGRGVLVSFLGSPDGSDQEFQLYDASDVADIEFFLDSIALRPALIFPGEFGYSFYAGEPVLSAKERVQRTINAICVDLDPINDDDGFPVPFAEGTISEILKRVPPALQPQYVNLSGNGAHFYYVFERPVQLFRIGGSSPRRRKYRSLVRALYAYLRSVTSDLGIKTDRQCETYCHGYRAPGSLTKSGSVVRCFCKPGGTFYPCVVDPLRLEEALVSVLPGCINERDLLIPADTEYLTAQQIDSRHRQLEAERLDAKRNTPATTKQVAFIESLLEREFLFPEEMPEEDYSSYDAGELIRLARTRMPSSSMRRVPDRPEWRTRPHILTAGSTGGVYRTILENIERVEVGRRYNSLYMLAGVAFMMDRPVKTFEDLEHDYFELLRTPWAQAGTPLTQRDIRNALLGYRLENWQTRRSEVEVLGFDPFGPSATRNGRTREEHLEKVARPALAKRRLEENVSAIADCLKDDPFTTKRLAAEITGLSYPTVSKYWALACASAGVEDTRSGRRGNPRRALNSE